MAPPQDIHGVGVTHHKVRAGSTAPGFAAAVAAAVVGMGAEGVGGEVEDGSQGQSGGPGGRPVSPGQ